MEEDIKQLQDLFETFIKDSSIHVMEYPYLREDLDNFMADTINSVRSIISKYAEQDMFREERLKQVTEESQALKHKNVKLNLASKKLVTAATEYINSSKR